MVLRLAKDQGLLSIKRSCQLMSLSRAAYYREENKLAVRDAPVVEALNAVVARHGRWGFWKCHDRLRLDGHPWNHKRVWRVYCQMKLNLPRRTKRRLIRPPQPLSAPLWPNEIWSLDFMSDSLYQGRRFRTLNILDEGVREALAIEIDTSLPALRVVRTLQQLESWRGLPKAIRLDNGPELTSQYLTDWCKDKGIELVSSSLASRTRMLSSSASTGPTGPRYSATGCLHPLTRCEKLRISGFKATTKNDLMTRWETCPSCVPRETARRGKLYFSTVYLTGKLTGLRLHLSEFRGPHA